MLLIRVVALCIWIFQICFGHLPHSFCGMDMRSRSAAVSSSARLRRNKRRVYRHRLTLTVRKLMNEHNVELDPSVLFSEGRDFAELS